MNSIGWKISKIVILIIAVIGISFWYNVTMMKTREETPSCTWVNEVQPFDYNVFKHEMISTNASADLPSGVWTVEPLGRFGNLMGQYATLYAFAKLHKHQAYILPKMHDELSELFKIKLPIIKLKVSRRIRWKTYFIKHNWMSDDYYNMSGEFVKITGYPYSWTFYHHIREEILREFTFHDFIKEESYAYLAKIQGDKANATFVGVHVRRGDYVSIMNRNKKIVVASKEYLQKAMDYFRRKYENPLFVVTSNGMGWCKENINNSLGDIHFAGDGKEGSPARDFALLAHCNHTIMTIGTFGLFAAYLAGGETIYLTNYTLPSYTFVTAFKYETIFLPEWIGIPADLSPLSTTSSQL
ncbi:galactoside alpha-(1,2)-fucosyltransferase 2-like [Hyperolius riggenbachi]|uniref:galactoside alpha-(1,2)-fucosyltransferase 2-like n=1 Tax=Hyperolius riggenbachi TaxID=752182 RepID=UPI0035A28779